MSIIFLNEDCLLDWREMSSTNLSLILIDEIPVSFLISFLDFSQTEVMRGVCFDPIQLLILVVSPDEML